MLTAFFLEDLLKDTILWSSNYLAFPDQDGNVVENVSDPRPRVAWIDGGIQGANGVTGAFTIYGGNQFIDLSETAAGSVTTLTIPTGAYTGAQLATKISALLTAAGSPYSTWVCTYGPSTHQLGVGEAKFYIGAQFGTFNAMVLRFGNGPNAANSTAGTLGFPDENSSDSTTHIAPEYRYSNHTWILFDVGEGNKSSLTMCEVDTDDPDGAEVDTSNITMYAHPHNLGPGSGSLAQWVASADRKLAYSAQPQYSENQVRVAFDTGGATITNKRFWLFSWFHEDEVKRHKVRLVKLFIQTMSATRTIQTLRGHGLYDNAAALGINNYYPVNQLKRWRIPLAFDAWSANDYRNVIHKVVRFGQQNGLLWALRWDEIADGSVQAYDEADKGYLVWSALTKYSRDSYVGEGADYMSGAISLEQVR